MKGIGWDVMGVIAVGIGAAAIMYALRHALWLAGRRVLPSWLLPAAIGGAMFSYAIWNEYTWFSRITAQLPESVEVLGTGAGGKAFRPWSFIVPVTTRFWAIDRREITTVGDRQEVRILLVERWRPTKTVRMAVDCAGRRQGPVDSKGEVVEWGPMPPSDPLGRALCAKGVA
ncbi:hypothetical protein [Paracoccus pacificus]|uniref:Uncharacterized protein n=1 Tax=Paracoccus pacificus TaxID=1463598 RepID=A0ABW4R506_9RHOB